MGRELCLDSRIVQNSTVCHFYSIALLADNQCLFASAQKEAKRTCLCFIFLEKVTILAFHSLSPSFAPNCLQSDLGHSVQDKEDSRRRALKEQKENIPSNFKLLSQINPTYCPARGNFFNVCLFECVFQKLEGFIVCV